VAFPGQIEVQLLPFGPPSDLKAAETTFGFEVLLTEEDMVVDIYNEDQAEISQLHSMLSKTVFAVVEDNRSMMIVKNMGRKRKRKRKTEKQRRS